MRVSTSRIALVGVQRTGPRLNLALVLTQQNCLVSSFCWAFASPEVDHENQPKKSGKPTMSLRFWRPTWRTYLLAAPLIVVLSIGGWAGGLQLMGNIHTIKPNEAYRAAQLNGSSLTGVLQKYGIKTVVNLRGKHVGRLVVR